MRKVILYIALSLDGYIADPTGKIDWLGGQDPNAAPSNNEYNDFIAQIDTVVMGYTTYHQVTTELSPNLWPYPGLQSYVLTHHHRTSTNKVHFLNQPAAELIRSLRAKPGKNLWIMGGTSIVTPLVEQDLIDEYHLSIMPMMLGDGIRLFQTQPTRIPLKLISSTTNNGVLDCIYQRRKG